MRRLRSFLSLFLSFTVRAYKKHAGRTILVLLGVALGAGVFTSVRLSVNASLEAMNSSLQAVTGPADYVISRPGRRMPDDTVRILAKHPGVERLAPILSVYVQEAGSGKTLRLVGVDPFMERSLGGQDRLSGSFHIWRRLFSEPFSLVVGSSAGAELGIKPGQAIELVSAAGTFSCRVLDIAGKQGLTSIDGGLLAVGDLATVQEISGLQHRIDRINCLLVPGADPGRIAAVLPPELELQRASRHSQTGVDMARAYDFNLTMLSFVSLFVGMFLVYSVVALNAASRRFEVAVLRSMGAGRRLVFCLFLLEGGSLGLLGWVLAAPLSLALTPWLIDDVGQTVSTLFVRVAVQGTVINGWEILLSFVVTLVVALLAAVQPAREAMSVPPWEAMRTKKQQGVTRIGLRGPALSGLALILAAWPVSRLPSPQGWPICPYLATFGLFIGFALLAPLLLRTLSRWLTPRFATIGGTPAFLAGKTMEQSGSRIAISVGALITAIALFVSLSIMTESFSTTFSAWIKDTISGDLFIRPLNAGSNNYQDPLPRKAKAWIENASDAGLLLPYQRYHLTYRGVPIQVETVDVQRFQQVGRYHFLAGSAKRAIDRMHRGEGALISESVAHRVGLGIGDSLSLTLAGTELKTEVAGVIRSYRTKGGVVFLSRSWFEKQTGVTEWSGVRLFFPGGQSDAKAKAFRSRLIQETDFASSLEITLGTDLRSAVLSIFRDTFAVTTVLLTIALVVAALGITSTLAVIILERTGDIATLTAIGAHASQIRSLLFWEAGYLVSTGVAAGFACGFILSAILVFVVNKVSFGWTFVYSVDWLELGLAVPLAVAAASLATIPVLRLIRRLPPAIALRQE